jgi:hypothetical protein
MKSKEDLYQLIRAMSKSEKRYFTIDAKKSGRRSSNYLELFHVINQMEDYDEMKLQKKFGKNLPTDKSYLYDAILRSMRDYRSSKSRTARIKEMILDARYLYERGLYRQCEDRFRQAKALALELDDQLSLLEISREQLNYVWVTKPKGYDQLINSLLQEKDRHIENINEELRYLAMSYKIQITRGQGAEAIKEKAHLYTSDSEEDSYPDSAHAQRRYLQSKALYNDLLAKDDEKANIFYARMVDWWDEYPAIKEEEYIRYIADIFNLLHNSYNQKKYEQFEYLIAKVEQEQPSNYHDQRLLFKQLTNYKLLYYLNLGIEEGHEQLVNQVVHGISSYKLNPVSQLIIAFNLMLLLFILARYEASLEWCEKILRLYNRTVNNEHFQIATLLIQIMNNYELEEIDQLDSSIRALQRHLKQSEYKGLFFREVTRFLRKSSHSTEAQRQRLLQPFDKKIRSILQDGEQPPLGMQDLVLNWVKSKLESKPLRMILREEATRES